ncbi:UNVERIFIED_CONTAM: hypothetical protein LBW93_04770 [Wolbachia endosymbiont of Nasonia longicornis]
MPILQQNALVTIYLKAFLLTITSINTSYATKPIWILLCILKSFCQNSLFTPPFKPLMYTSVIAVNF